eukprot:m.14324 g.14324  ORF g.14324 m.14324 type:complete len:211 (-) comp10257_c0_seq1:90-722(-)
MPLASRGYVDFDVTEDVLDIMEGFADYGWMVTVKHEATHNSLAIFASSEAAIASRRPSLQVTYRLQPPTTMQPTTTITYPNFTTMVDFSTFTEPKDGTISSTRPAAVLTTQASITSVKDEVRNDDSISSNVRRKRGVVVVMVVVAVLTISMGVLSFYKRSKKRSLPKTAVTILHNPTYAPLFDGGASTETMLMKDGNDELDYMLSGNSIA